MVDSFFVFMSCVGKRGGCLVDASTIDASIILEYYGYTPLPGNTMMYCPFHAEQTPSCNVNSVHGAFYCFGCGAKGDVFDLVAEIEHVDPMQAGMIIFTIPGVVEGSTRGESIMQQKSREVSLAQAQAFYDSLPHIDWRMYTDSYLLRRGFAAQTLNYFGVRVNHGALNPLIFPLYEQGNFVGYVARRIDAEKHKKYINSPGLERKSVLIGDLEPGLVAVVEGQLDRMMTWQEGVRNVAAILGGDVTEGQVEKLAAVATRVVSMLDNEPKGEKATIDLRRKLAPYGIPVERFCYPVGCKDVPEMTRGSLTKYYYLGNIA